MALHKLVVNEGTFKADSNLEEITFLRWLKKRMSELSSTHTIIFTFFQGFLRLVQAPRVYPGGRLCIVAERTHKENKKK